MPTRTPKGSRTYEAVCPQGFSSGSAIGFAPELTAWLNAAATSSVVSDISKPAGGGSIWIDWREATGHNGLGQFVTTKT